jgi:hypothetical protein
VLEAAKPRSETPLSCHRASHGIAALKEIIERYPSGVGRLFKWNGGAMLRS